MLHVGHAKLTGPGDYGDLHVPYVIHAVGPCYFDYEKLSEGDALLASAYSSTLEQAHLSHLQQVAFSLLSAGVYRGEQSLSKVLTIGIETILQWTRRHQQETSLTHVYMCGFNARECNALVDICEDDLKLEVVNDEEDHVADEQEEEERKQDDACRSSSDDDDDDK